MKQVAMRRSLSFILAAMFLIAGLTVLVSAERLPAIDKFEKIEGSFTHEYIRKEKGEYVIDLSELPLVAIKQSSDYLLIWTHEELGDEREAVFQAVKGSDAALKKMTISSVHFYSGTFEVAGKKNIGPYSARLVDGKLYMFVPTDKVSHFIFGMGTTTTTQPTATTTQPTTTTTQPTTTTTQPTTTTTQPTTTTTQPTTTTTQPTTTTTQPTTTTTQPTTTITQSTTTTTQPTTTTTQPTTTTTQPTTTTTQPTTTTTQSTTTTTQPTTTTAQSTTTTTQPTTVEEEEIEDPTIPLADPSTSTSLVTTVTTVEELEEIEDPTIPLTGPKTGDSGVSWTWIGLLLLSGAMVLMTMSRAQGKE